MTPTNPSPRRLLLGAALRSLAGVLSFVVLLFWPAGTLDFWQAWVYLVVLFAPLPVLAIFLATRDPQLLERRMKLDETDPRQKRAILSLTLVILAILLVPGFDHRYGWSSVPLAWVVISDGMVLLGYLLFALTIRENRFASRVVAVQQEQQVISTGPYALVRHLMYLAMSTLFLFSPLALDSWWGLLPSVLFPLAMVPRIRNEEALLSSGLPGYVEYTRKVRFRLIPLLW